MKKCKHRFKPRYNEKYTTLLEELVKLKREVNRLDDKLMVPYLKEKLYIYDICSRCGQIIKKM